MKLRVGPSGVHFFDRTTGLNILLDEVRLDRPHWSPAPRQVSIALTNVCDLKCPYCYAPKNVDALDFSRLLDWITELDEGGCLGVGFGGGEPTLYHRFAELCSRVSHQTRLAVTFTTHGHGLDEGLLRDLRDTVHFVRVSVDGFGRTYERLRGRPFAAICRQLEMVRSLAPFGMNYVVNALTVGDLDSVAALATEAGDVEFLLLPQRPVAGLRGIDSETRQKLATWVARYQGNVRLAVSETDAHGFRFCDPFADEAGLSSYAHIDASGSLRRSSYDSVGVGIGGSGVMRALEVLRNHCEDGVS